MHREHLGCRGAPCLPVLCEPSHVSVEADCARPPAAEQDLPGRAAVPGNGGFGVRSCLARLERLPNTVLQLTQGRHQISLLGWNWELLIRLVMWYEGNRPVPKPFQFLV